MDSGVNVSNLHNVSNLQPARAHEAPLYGDERNVSRYCVTRHQSSKARASSLGLGPLHRVTADALLPTPPESFSCVIMNSIVRRKHCENGGTAP